MELFKEKNTWEKIKSFSFLNWNYDMQFRFPVLLNIVIFAIWTQSLNWLFHTLSE